MTGLTLPLPPLANRYWRIGHGHLYRCSEADNYRRTLMVLLRQAKCRCLHGPVWVTIRVYRKRKAGDLDGYLKVLLDALQGLAFENDRQVRQLVASLEPEDKVHPRVEVTVTEAPGLKVTP